MYSSKVVCVGRYFYIKGCPTNPELAIYAKATP
jgi:hypothetical protein